VGNVRFAANGAWEKPQVLMIQQRGIGGNGLDQFRDAGRHVVLHAKELKSGDVRSPHRPA